MKYVAKRRADGSLEVTLTLSSRELSTLAREGRAVELFDGSNPDQAFLGVSFGSKTDYNVACPDGSYETIRAYGDLHAFAVAASNADSEFTLSRGWGDRAAA